MFQEWGFLLTEIWMLIVLAALLGLFAGWLIFGGRTVEQADDLGASASGEAEAGLCACQEELEQKDAMILQLRTALSDAESRVSAAQAQALAAQTPFVAVAEEIEEGAAEQPSEGVKPEGLSEARGGAPDDLKRIKGIGPKLEILCNRLGYYHFDQIAAWTEAEVAWVDDNLEGFKGRVTRDEWVSQARVLAEEL